MIVRDLLQLSWLISWLTTEWVQSSPIRSLMDHDYIRLTHVDIQRKELCPAREGSSIFGVRSEEIPPVFVQKEIQLDN